MTQLTNPGRSTDPTRASRSDFHGSILQETTVLLVGNYEVQAQESMHRFASLMTGFMSRHGIPYELVKPMVILGRFGNPHRGVGKWLGYIDKFILFVPVLWHKSRRSKIIHICDHSNAPYVRIIRAKNTIVTCHDALAIRSALNEFPENRVSWTGRLLQGLIASSLGKSDCLACVSAATLEDLRRLELLGKSRSTVVPLPLNFDYFPIAAAAASLLLTSLNIDVSTPYFMHVGGNQWYKNRMGVLALYAELVKKFGRDEQLLMFGKEPTPEMNSAIARLGITKRVKFFTGVENSMLQAAYSNARALLFPSLAEGFGWPILEAQACGCPVVTSSAAPMSDVAGLGAILIDPLDTVEAAILVQLGLQNSEKVAADGLENIKRFSLQKFDDSYELVYEQLLQARER